MIKLDQSYVNTDKSNLSKFKSDKEKRSKLIKKNFELLIKKTKQTGFPNVFLGQPNKDSCMNGAVTMTMIHTAQTSPDKFYGNTIAELFKIELVNGNLDKELLKRSSIVTAMTIELCDNLKPRIEKTLELWDLDKDIFKQAEFINCE